MEMTHVDGGKFKFNLQEKMIAEDGSNRTTSHSLKSKSKSW